MSDQRLRVAIDPNVYVSAAVAPSGTTAEIVRAAFSRRISVVVSSHLVQELSDVLARSSFRRYLSLEEAQDLVAAIEAVAATHGDPSHVAAVSRDPDDDYLVALAVTAGAALLVTGDRDLLEVSDPGIEVPPPPHSLTHSLTSP